eukprot:TRINITY_DN10105_c0_g5_i1.p1 TRINITY_DN10105_c0_g5~~TRINITY_DN10105_c0_g5_i1.p1  ORF type:complete len:938 (-),score=121.62 TRINITY_DN10105_c0_g5_i1:30-2744(-)
METDSLRVGPSATLVGHENPPHCLEGYAKGGCVPSRMILPPLQKQEQSLQSSDDEGEAFCHQDGAAAYDDLLMVPGGLDKLLARLEESGSSRTHELLADRLYAAQQALANGHAHAVAALTQAVGAQSAAEMEVIALREENLRLRTELTVLSEGTSQQMWEHPAMTTSTFPRDVPGCHPIRLESKDSTVMVAGDGVNAMISQPPPPPAAVHPGQASTPSPPQAVPPHRKVTWHALSPGANHCAGVGNVQQSHGSFCSAASGAQWFEAKDGISERGTVSRAHLNNEDAPLKHAREVSDVHRAQLPSLPTWLSPRGAAGGKAIGVASEVDHRGRSPRMTGAFAGSSWNRPSRPSSAGDRAPWQRSSRVADSSPCVGCSSSAVRDAGFDATNSLGSDCSKDSESLGAGKVPGSSQVGKVLMEDQSGGVARKEKFDCLSRSSSQISSEIGENSATAFGMGDVGPISVFVDVDTMKQKVRQTIMKNSYKVSDFYRDGSCWTRIAKSAWFDQATLFTIACNAIWIAIDTDYNKEPVLSMAHPVFQVGEHTFCVFFVVELLVRFLAFNKKADMMKDPWCVFDTCLVVFMVFETWIMPTIFYITKSGSNFGGVDPSVLRLLRLLRLSRMARMARIFRAIPELMIMIKGMAAATRSVFVTLLLLTACIYIFAIAFTQLTDASPCGKKYFATVPRAMNSLLDYGVIMEDTPELVNDVGAEHVLLGALFLVFVLLASFTVLNMLIGVMCETVRVVSTVEHEQNVVSYTKARLLKMLVESKIDIDGNDMISQSEFNALLDIPEAVRALRDVGVDVVGLVELSDFIFERAAELRFHEFMEVILELRGSNTATVKDIVDLRRFMKQEIGRINKLLLAIWPDDERRASLQRSFVAKSKARSAGRSGLGCEEGRGGKLERR